VNKTIISAILATPLLVGGAAYLTSANAIYHSNYVLTSETSEALVMIPAFNQQWLDVTNELYLEPNGFDGTPVWLEVPETYDLDGSVKGATDILVNAIEQRWSDHDFSETDPLYIFGYSQASVVAGLAEPQLEAYGIPSDALHFVLVGDSASANGGFLNEFIPWLNQFFPESWQQSIDDFVTEMLKQFNAGSVFGAVTPDHLYPTDVYTLTGDGWANWDDGTNTSGMFSQHLAYLGLTPEEINSATESTDGLTNYFTIDSADVDFLSAFTKALDIGVSPFI
jgi:hypothetical protein